MLTDTDLLRAWENYDAARNRNATRLELYALERILADALDETRTALQVMIDGVPHAVYHTGCRVRVRRLVKA